ncbi:MAG: VIT and VWA domain-containing protein [Chthoniobacter sp.]
MRPSRWIAPTRFPLPAGAAVYRCELHVNGRVIRAKVEEKDAARRIFREQKAAGRRAALVETERENIFTLSLGNVQPEDVIVVRFAWFQMLDRVGDSLRLLVPTCLGVRYIPGKPLLRELSGRGTVDDTDEVPDASRITPPRIDALHPDAAYFSLEGRVSLADVESGSVSSPSHAIYVRESDGAARVELSGRAAVPDRDLVLAWREPKARQLAPQGWRWTEGDATYALVQLRAPEGVPVVDGFSQDIYFLIDRSGSMVGAKWQRTCEALRAFVGLLGAADRVWITLFESGYQDFAEAPMPAPEVLADRGFQQMEALGTGGGTELRPAAIHVVQQIAHHSAGRHTSVVLITDGQVGNDAQILQTFRQVPQVRVHTFGIDTAVNDAFLRSLARQQRGGCWLQTPDDDIAGTIAALGDRLRRPVLTSLSVGSAWEAGRGTLPDLHAQEIVAVPLRGGAAHALEITGRTPDGSEHRFSVELNAGGSAAVKLLWAKERIDFLLATQRQPEAIALAKQHNLICQGAAFIAWDEAEQVPIAAEEIVQPAMAPHFAALACAPPPESEHRVRQVDLKACEGHASAGPRAVYHMQPPESVPTHIAKLREGFAWANIRESTLTALEKFVRSGDHRVERQLEALSTTALLTGFWKKLSGPVLWERLMSSIRQALKASPATLLKWPIEVPFAQLLDTKRKLETAGMPKELVDELLAWVMESKSFDQDRWQKLEALVTSVDEQTFSTSAKTRRWWTFLEKTVGVDSKAYAVALRCLPRATDAAGSPSAQASA